MLIQITNRCQEGCRHCLQNALPDGPLMTEATFRKALEFGRFLRCPLYIISGGEPTEHPQFLEFCKMFDRLLGKEAAFTVTSNGMWYPEQKDMVEKLSRLKSFVGMQVYSHPKWYKDYDFIMAHKAEIESIDKVKISNETIYMQDLGRACNDEEAQAEVAKNPYFMSCVNGHLLFKQMSSLHRMNGMKPQGTFCKPMVDYKGDVHLSESCLCPSFGNVNTDLFMKLFNQLRNAKPCLKCAGGKRFFKSTRPDIMMAKELFGL